MVARLSAAALYVDNRCVSTLQRAHTAMHTNRRVMLSAKLLNLKQHSFASEARTIDTGADE
eukprot:CAMPEP_0181180252 /NCGR_PEP_ID=MMETSP1096-20121128/6698_1 /TAXON_ID=156174 ORGANISM="Chrysochromulina ericina, Strain CCMP281" /NCGR_SAMPLE_ID=MMETSP1096 /ASSEMBLY_ACC=CAM_ASM_000453 /LENGTH=60 /DNA_ID=CAMNT_0023268663 /DNA_START=450 /DNA_END=629 /DNA_ORIENTATION=+